MVNVANISLNFASNIWIVVTSEKNNVCWLKGYSNIFFDWLMAKNY